MSNLLREQLQTSLGASYSLERELGGGGMSCVFVARDLRLERSVVVKALSPELAAGISAERFTREIKLAAALQEPHIVPVISDGVTANGTPYYVMPFVRGASLRQRMIDGPVPSSEVIGILRDVAKALAYAHRAGIVHRDIKPENVLLSEGTAVVADFGIAKALMAATHAGADRVSGLTSAGVAIGTPAYMAPEQAVADGAVDQRADLYALGVIAYELLSGRHPFAGRTAQALIAAHLTERPERLAQRCADVPAALDALVMRLLAKDPAERPESADAVLRALGDSSATTDAPAARPRRMHILAAAMVLTAGLALGGYIAFGAGTGRGASTPGASTTIRSIAVLPFVNTSGSSAEDYFSDGLTDELAHALGRIVGLRIAGRTSSYSFKGRSIAAQEIGKALDVGALVAGTVRRAGDRLRVTTQLVSTVDGKVLWDSVYESRSADVFAVQDELTRSVVAALTPTLGGGRHRAADVGRGTSDEIAYDLYLKGRYSWLQRGGANIRRSIELFQQAVARDPSFARAHAALAMAYSTLPVYGNDSRDPASDTLSIDRVVQLVKSSAERAAALDSTLADAQLALGAALDTRLRFREALVRYRKGVALDASSVTGHHWLGMSLLGLGETEPAIVELRHATTLDPLNVIANAALGTALLYGRHFPEAANQARRVLALDSTFAFGSMVLAQAQIFSGAPDSAIQIAQEALRGRPRHNGLLSTLLFADAAAGRWDDAARIRDRMRTGGNALRSPDAAFAELVFGDPEPAVRLMTSTEGQLIYSSSGALLGCNPLLDPLWSDARFREAMRKLDVPPCPLARPLPLPARSARVR
ncbi:MAG TPA: protein kinase [Gemmatimonadaceae bacterium]|nr:protein kinase [Gemmatimonadaceae bacterium]